MVVAGHDGARDHVQRILTLSQEMLQAASRVAMPERAPGTELPSRDSSGSDPDPKEDLGATVRVRVGVHTGSAFAGVIGIKMPRWSFFGDVINTASRMESTGFPMCVQVSNHSFKLALAAGMLETDFAEFGKRDIKGKGRMRTHLLRVGDWMEAVAQRDSAAEAGAVPPPSVRDAGRSPGRGSAPWFDGSNAGGDATTSGRLAELLVAEEDDG